MTLKISNDLGDLNDLNDSSDLNDLGDLDHLYELADLANLGDLFLSDPRPFGLAAKHADCPDEERCAGTMLGALELFAVLTFWLTCPDATRLILSMTAEYGMGNFRHLSHLIPLKQKRSPSPMNHPHHANVNRKRFMNKSVHLNIAGRQQRAMGPFLMSTRRFKSPQRLASSFLISLCRE